MANEQQPPLNTNKTTAPEYDIQTLIHKIKTILPMTVKFKWVKGHQNKDKKTGQKIYGPFPRKVDLNIIADKEAHRTACITQHLSPRQPTYSTTIMGLYTKDNVYIADMHHHITMVLHQQTLWNYLLKKMIGNMETWRIFFGWIYH